MNLHDLHELQDVHTYPCLTITLPTHRTRPDNRQDPISRQESRDRGNEPSPRRVLEARGRTTAGSPRRARRGDRLRIHARRLGTGDGMAKKTSSSKASSGSAKAKKHVGDVIGLSRARVPADVPRATKDRGGNPKGIEVARPRKARPARTVGGVRARGH